jgi:fumarate reductase subunit C
MVTLLSIFFFLCSLADLIFTLFLLSISPDIESNPIAAVFCQNPVTLSVYKLSLVALILTITTYISFSRRRLSILILSFGCLVTFLTASYGLYAIKEII